MRLKYYDAWLTGLAINCPFMSRVDTCPLKNMKDLPLPEKVDLIEKMGKDEMEKIIMHHEACFKKREMEFQ
ncbi:MAG: hypothetical protein OEU95_08770 [Nitrospirota bacterium]|nr:hypothetical protein [Nitrospirota bacterium]